VPLAAPDVSDKAKLREIVGLYRRGDLEACLRFHGLVKDLAGVWILNQITPHFVWLAPAGLHHLV
jgi:hypothetical protein